MFNFLKDRKRVIKDRDSNEPYLVRWYLFLKDRKNFPFNITLHKVLVSDEPTLHDHPWSYATFIIKGGYYENTPKGRLWRGPGHFRYRSADDLHYLELAKDDEFYKGVCNGMFYAMLILGHPKDEIIKKFPRAHWWCKDCRIGSGMWYEVKVPVWNCPRCKKEWPPYAKENSDEIN